MAPEAPMYRVYTLAGVASDSMVDVSFTMLTLGVAAALAMILGIVGLYGILSYIVAQRAREIGVRLAVGSAPREIVALVLREGLGLAIGGIVLGTIGALSLGRLVVSQLYGIAPTNPWVMLLMMLTLTVVATIACIVPARRAANVDVMKILSAP